MENAYTTEIPARITASEVYYYASKLMDPQDIDHHGNGNGLDDLYLKVTPVSDKLVKALRNSYPWAGFINKFVATDGSGIWYELPFCYPVVENETY